MVARADASVEEFIASEPVKVLLISPRYRGGGAERCARELFERLPSVGVETEMWVAARHASDPPGVKSIRLPGERWLYPLDYLPSVNDWRHLGSRLRLDAIRPGDFDVVHLHNVHGRWISIKALHRLCQRVPVVWTLHDEWAVSGGIPYDLTRVMSLEQARQHTKGLSRLVFCHPSSRTVRWERFLKHFLPQPHVLLSPSQYLFHLSEEATAFSRSTREHVPYGLTLLEHRAITMSKNEARSTYNIPRDAYVVLFIAAQLGSPYKGARFAIECLRALRNRMPESSPPRLLLLGRGANALRESLGKVLTVCPGWADDAVTLAAAYRAADVTLLPSIADNFPYVALESFACCTPVVAFRIGGLKEMVDNSERGRLACPFDTKEMAQHLAQLLLARQERERIGENARRWVTENCWFPQYVDRVLKSYALAQQAITGRPPP